MKDERKQNWTPYIRKMMDLYGLKDWNFEIADNEPVSNAIASVVCVEGRRYAVIRFANDFLTEKKEDQRTVILHELTHCHLHLVQKHVDLNIHGDHGKIFHQLIEYSVDAIANSIASFFPLPE